MTGYGQPSDFHRDLEYSKTPGADALIRRVLASRWPGFEIEKACLTDDKAGSDYWIMTQRRLGIDIKLRRRDCRGFRDRDGNPVDDVCLEIQSAIGMSDGWAKQPGRLTDYIVWIWSDSGRSFCLSSHELSQVVRLKETEWLKKYSRKPATTARGETSTYATQCVFVPMSILNAALSEWRSGEKT